MRRLAELTIVRFLVGGGAVAVTYVFGWRPCSWLLLRLKYFWNVPDFVLIPLGDIAIALTAVAVYAVYVRLMEKRSLTEFSHRGAAAELGKGCFWVIVVFAAALFTPLYLHGNLVIDGIGDWRNVPPVVGMAVDAGVCEEILFRGLLFRLTERSLGSVLAVVVSSLFFGVMHLLNPGATLFSAMGIGLEAGLGLSALYMLTRRLWICIAMHFMWNLINGLMGYQNVGSPTGGLLRTSLTGNPLLTGGEFGVETSAITIGLGVVIGIWLLALAYRRGCFVRGFWVREERSD